MGTEKDEAGTFRTRLGSWFLAQAPWTRLLVWLLLFWLLIPIFIWRTSLRTETKVAMTATFFVLLLFAVAGASDSGTDSLPPTTTRNDPLATGSRTLSPPSRSPYYSPEAAATHSPSPPASASPPPSPSPSPMIEVPPGIPPDLALIVDVIEVIDGDTIDVVGGGQEFTVRLIGIDAPESVNPSEPVECFSKKASEFTRAALEGETIVLEFDVEPEDRFGRTLAYVWKSGKLFNRNMVAKGYALVSTFPPNVKYEDRFVRAEGIAEENNIGPTLLDSRRAVLVDESGGYKGFSVGLSFLSPLVTLEQFLRNLKA